MPIVQNLKDLLLQRQRDTEFNVSTGNFADLAIRPGNNAFHYFYDSRSRRLIKSFILRDGPQVDTMCDVALIKKDDVFTPRLSFWKKDKTKGSPDTATEAELVAEGRTVLIKSRVNVTNCHENFWRLIDFVRTYKGVELPEHGFRVASRDAVDLAKAFEGHDKTAVLGAVKTYLEGQVTEQDVQMLLDRRKTLERFGKLLTDAKWFDAEKTQRSTGDEGVWQAFFEENTWIFGYGLTLVACEKYNDKRLEQMTTGSNVFTGGGKRSDAVMRTKGFIQTLIFAEIKKHSTDLLMAKQYREPDVYQVSSDLSGAVSQVQKTAHKAVKGLQDLHRTHNPDGAFQFEVSTIRPRQVVVIGDLHQLADGGETNLEKMTSFELYRRDHQAVEILTFDELYERTKYIVESQESDQATTTL